MDYKKIIKNKNIRNKILSMLSFVPDKTMLKLQYRIKTGRRLNLKNPQRFTEKLQHYKLYYRDPLMKKCVDKYDVREYVKEKGYGDALIPLIGIYDSADEIDHEMLPDQFVAKDTLGGGGNDVIICKDKARLNIQEIKSKMEGWTKKSTSYRIDGREWPYGGKKHRIIIEKFLESNENEGGLIDYKFFCFSGKCEYIYVIADRVVGKKAGLGIYDKDYNRIQAIRCDENPLERNVEKPAAFEQMKAMSEALSAPFPEARIDLYYHHEKIFFGEITFYDGSGYMTFEPDKFDYILGEKFDVKNQIF